MIGRTGRPRPRDIAGDAGAGYCAMLTDASSRTGHVIVVGLDGVALRTVEQLHLAGVPVVVVEDEHIPAAAAAVDAWEIPRIFGSAGLPQTLDSAGLAGAAAVVCVQENDLHALETALLVRRLRPDVRLVVQMANPGVGRAVADLTGRGSVLDVAAVSAPSVVEACLRSKQHRLAVEGTEFLAAELTVTDKGTLRTLFGDLAPVAVLPAGGRHEPGEPDIVICPGRDHPVLPGDRVVAVAEVQEMHGRLGRGSTPIDGAARRLRRPSVNLARVARALIGETDRALRVTLALLVLLFVTSVCVLRLGYEKTDGTSMTLLDAMYFTVETIGTIGYGDFSFAQQEPWLRAYAIGLMLCGTGLAAVSFAMLTNMLVTRRIADALGRRNLGRLRGHMVIVGLGSVGIRVVEALHAQGRHVVVVDRDEDNRYLSQARALGVPIVIADATQPATLATVGLEGAAAVAVLTSDDLVNIETGLAVRNGLGDRWGDIPVVLRIFDTGLGETVEAAFGFDHVRST
ncbi:MAG TPA: potassium channel family protein, partial [Sporichthya sp.]|nr:potassium channel family protein [Sporichthya sp.]